LQTIDEQRLGQQLVDQTEHTKNLLDQLVPALKKIRRTLPSTATQTALLAAWVS
jgi:hypothetical protein